MQNLNLTMTSFKYDKSNAGNASRTSLEHVPSKGILRSEMSIDSLNNGRAKVSVDRFKRAYAGEKSNLTSKNE